MVMMNASGVGWGNFGGCERTAANPLEAQTTYQNKQILILYKSI